MWSALSKAIGALTGGVGGGSRPYGVAYADNDYQLAIELSKELEFRLERELGAEGKGLHEKVSSVDGALPVPTVRALRYVASVRNALIHDRDVRTLPDRARFIARFEAASDELQVLSDKKRLDASGKLRAGAAGSSAECVIS